MSEHSYNILFENVRFQRQDWDFDNCHKMMKQATYN